MRRCCRWRLLLRELRAVRVATNVSHPGLLSLSTVRLPNGDFANLVLFTSSEAKDHWNDSPLHYDLVAKIFSPRG